MGTKTVCVHRFIMPPLSDFKKKYYFLVSTLLFEYESNGYYRDDLEILGFSEAEMRLISSILTEFYIDGRTLKIENFDISIIGKMIMILPEDKRKLLLDHIILSSIDKSEDIKTFLITLKTNLNDYSAVLPLQEFNKLDFYNFFRNEESSFMDEYYPTEDLKDELRLQYGLKK